MDNKVRTGVSLIEDRCFGVVFRAVCPNCHDAVIISECDLWEAKCECGYNWHVEIYAEGIKED